MNEERNRLALLNSIRKWTLEEVKEFLVRNNLSEFTSFADAKALDGFKLLNLSEGIVALWRPKLNIKKFMAVIKDLNENPQKHINRKSNMLYDIRIEKLFEKNPIQNTNTNYHIEKDAYKKNRHISILEKHPNALNVENKLTKTYILDPDNRNTTFQISRFTVQRVLEDEYPKILLKNEYNDDSKFSENICKEDKINTNPYTDMTIVIDSKKNPIRSVRSSSFTTENPYPKPLKSFLYSKSLENVVKRLHDYETMQSKNPNCLKDIEISSEDTITDKGYYEMMREQWKTRRHSDGSLNILENPYEELCYNNGKFEDKKRPGILEKVLKKPSLMKKENIGLPKPKSPKKIKSSSCKDYHLNKANDNNFNISFTQKYKHLPELDLVPNDVEIYNDCYSPVKEESHIEFAQFVVKEALDNLDLDLKNVLDNICYESCGTKIVVEEYLEPREVPPSEKKTAMDQVLEEAAMNFYRNNVQTHSKEPENNTEVKISMMSNNNEVVLNITKEFIPQAHPIPAPRKPRPMLSKIKNDVDIDNDKPFSNLQKWNENLKNRIELTRRNMSERPLPIPVENEFFYMEVSRQEAVQLLEGHADGTFILRPSSQAIHAYTITLTYQGRIYNIGCRRRQDGRFALGFRKSNEQSFLTINDLIEHHYNEKLILLVDGEQVGSTVLKKLTD